MTPADALAELRAMRAAAERAVERAESLIADRAQGDRMTFRPWSRLELHEARLDMFERGATPEIRQAAHERAWREEHSPALARAEQLEEARHLVSEVSRLAYESETAYGFEAKQLAVLKLDEARDARDAHLLGQPVPLSLLAAAEARRRRDLFGLCGPVRPGDWVP